MSPTSDAASDEDVDGSPYDTLGDSSDDGRWAFGTGFSDPLAGVDTSLPDGVDGADLAAYCLMLGDDALVMSHRLQQWLTRAPELEEETAIANVALDLLGQARLLLSRAGHADGSGRSEDDVAFLREAHEYRNVRLVEPGDPDFAGLVVRLATFSTWRLALLHRLTGSADPVLAAVAAAAVPELAYHRDWSAQWVVRLGDGTATSRARVAAALDAVAPLVPELFEATDVERRLAAAGVAVDPADARGEVEEVLSQVLAEATVAWPSPPARSPVSGRTGRGGAHTEALGPLLAELQHLARCHPGAVW